MKPLFHIDRRLFLNRVFAIGFILSLIGILFISSTEHSRHYIHFFYIKQAISLIISVLVYLFVARFDYHRYTNFVVFIYISGVFLLVSVLIFGVTINGARSWISLGFYNGQLAEFSKIAYIISFASFIDRYKDDVYSNIFFVYSLIFLVPFILFLILQPDLGTAIVFFGIFFAMFFAGGGKANIFLFFVPISIISISLPFLDFCSRSYARNNSFLAHFHINFLYVFISGILIIVMAIIVFLIYQWTNKRIFFALATCLTLLSLGCFGAIVFKACLKPYHYNRILVTLDPSIDPEKKGYNLNQSLIAIGGGKLFGYGLTQGLQNKGHFLPASHTDFILSIIAEEWGFCGIILIIILNVLLIYNILKIAYETRDFLGFLIIIGVASLFMCHFVINTLSVIGIFPIIGIPLPFLSYGGSFLLTCFIVLGLSYNINSTRYKFDKTISKF